MGCYIGLRFWLFVNQEMDFDRVEKFESDEDEKKRGWI